MGDEDKQDETKAETQQPAEEKKEEKAAQGKKEEEKPAQEQEEPKPPSPFVLFVDLHCVGCAKKIEKSIMRIRGVEGVDIDMAQNQVTIKGIVEPQAVCAKIKKKTRREAKVLSPLPAAEGEPMPEVVTSQVSGLTTVELNVNMHCEACAEQLKRKILKMRGVQTVVTEPSTEKVTVTGTMDANKLVNYVYRRTKRQAKIVPQPEPEPQTEPQPEAKPESNSEKPAEENKEAAEKPAEEAKPAEEEKPPEEAKKEESSGENKEEKEGAKKEGENNNINIVNDEENLKRMMYLYQPVYVIEQIPPPQLFSDENPNACCIS